MDEIVGLATLASAALLTTPARAMVTAAESTVDRTPSELSSTADEPLLRDLLDELANPVAGTVSIPLESTWDVGAAGDVRYTLELDPVIPLRISRDWLVVHRFDLPIIWNGPQPGDGMSGFGDTEWSAFLSPAQRWKGWDWGAGFALLLPTAAAELGDDAWSAGPSASAVYERGTWTLAVLGNQVWSFAERSSERVSRLLLDPWVEQNWDSGFGWRLESEAEYDWEQSEWTVPLELSASRLVKLSEGSIDVELTGIYYAARAAGDATWGMRFAMTLVFGDD